MSPEQESAARMAEMERKIDQMVGPPGLKRKMTLRAVNSIVEQIVGVGVPAGATVSELVRALRKVVARG